MGKPLTLEILLCVFRQDFIIPQYFGFYVVRHRRMVLVSFGSTSSKKQVTSRLYSLKSLTSPLGRLFNADLDVASSDVVEGVSLFEGVGCMSFWVNLGFPLRADLMDLFLDFPEQTDHISETSVTAQILTTLKVFSMDSMPEIYLRSCSFLESMTCLGVTDKCSISKSYLLTSYMESVMGTLEIRFSFPISVIFVFMQCGNMLQNIIQLGDSSGRLRPKIETNLEFFSHWIKAMRGSDCGLGILDTRLYGYFWSG